MSTVKPFEFRAPEPLKSNMQGFHFSPITEQERIGDTLKKNVLFENEQFDKDFLVKSDLHRTATKTRWVSPKDFSVTTRKEGFMPNTDSKRHSSTIRSRGNQSSTFSNRGQSFCFGADLFEDPKIDPGFVRTTKDYLKTLHIKNVEREIKRKEQSSFNQTFHQQEESQGGYNLSFMKNTSMSKMGATNAVTTRNLS